MAPSFSTTNLARQHLTLVSPEALVAALDARLDTPDPLPPESRSVKRHDDFIAPGITLYRYVMEGGYSLALHVPTVACRGDVPGLIGQLAAAIEREISRYADESPSEKGGR